MYKAALWQQKYRISEDCQTLFDIISNPQLLTLHTSAAECIVVSERVKKCKKTMRVKKNNRKTTLVSESVKNAVKTCQQHVETCQNVSEIIRNSIRIHISVSERVKTFQKRAFGQNFLTCTLSSRVVHGWTM